MPHPQPKLCFVGPMLGQNPGWVMSQGEIQAQLFATAGYPVRLTSTIPNRALRLLDTVKSLLAWRKETDLILLMVFSGPAFGMADISSLVARRLGIPLVLWLHGGNLPNFSAQHPAWVRRVLRRGELLVSPSGYLAHFFREWGLQVKVVPNVLHLEEYPYRHRQAVAPHLLWMRTFHDIYYPELALEVLAELRQTEPKARLTMAGQDKGLLSAVKALVTKKGLQEEVRFVGFLDLAGKQREFAAHDIFLNTNRVDNMPVSVVEAAACGLPVVATKVGGLPFLLQDEETGLLVENEDGPGMVRAVRRLVNDKGLAGRLSAQGRALAEQCAWPEVKTQWEELFAEVL